MDPILFETSVPPSQVFGLLGTSIGIAAASALLAGAIGVLMALLLYLSGQRTKSGWMIALVLPLVWSPFLTAIGWMILQGESGITLFQRASFDSWSLSLLFSPIGVVLVHSISFWPVPAFLSWWGFQRLDSDMVDQFRIEGVSIKKTAALLCRLNLLPITVGCLVVSVFSLGELGAPEMLQVNTFPVLLYSELNLVRTLAPILRMSAPLILFMVVGILAWSLFRKRIRIESESLDTTLLKDRWVSPFWPKSYLTLLLIAGPGVVAMTEILQVFRDFSTIHLPLLTECFSASIWTGLGSVFLVGVLLQIGLLFSRNRWVAPLIDGTSFLLFAVPSPVLALIVLKFLSSMGVIALPLLDSFWILSLACALHFFWVAWMLVQSGEEQIPLTLRDQMATEGLRPHQRLWHILIPLLRPQAMAGLFFVWALTIGEVTLTRILQPPGIQTLAARTVNFMHWGHDGMVAAGLLLVAFLEFFPLLVYIAWKEIK